MKFIKMRSNNSYNINDESEKNVIITNNEKYEKEVFRFTLLLECIYAFCFGYNLFYIQNNFKELMILFFTTLLFSLCFIRFPYELIKALVINVTSENNEVIMKYSFFKLYYNVETKGYTEKSNVMLSLITPLIFLTVLPTIIASILGFNLIAYAIAIACSIISARDIVDIYYLIKKVPHEGKIKHTGKNYILEV